LGITSSGLFRHEIGSHASIQGVGMLEFHHRRLTAENGQVLVEYALIVSLIAFVTIGLVATIGLNVSTMISEIGGAL
jgi:Flp pilus assembly pilin Flp